MKSTIFINLIISGLSSVSSDLLVEIVKYEISKYYDENLIEQRSFFTKIPSEKIMTWSKKLISEPLKKMPENLHHTARQIYKSIQ